MEYNLSFISTGCNGTGFSSLLSLEKTTLTETKILNRILINVGEGTQRICNENKIKLFFLTTIVITSLVPHCISGFAGIFLALSDLGIGEITVIGPPGLKIYLDSMIPFINRKYPVLKIQEIDYEINIEILGASISCCPITPQNASKVVAISYTIDLFEDVNELIRPSKHNSTLYFLPIAYYFRFEQQYEDIIQRNEKESILVFIPMTVFTFEQKYLIGSIKDSPNYLVPNLQDSGIPSQQKEIYELCESTNSIGFLFTDQLHSEHIEYHYCQELLSLLKYICRPIFPLSLVNLEFFRDNRTQNIESIDGYSLYLVTSLLSLKISTQFDNSINQSNHNNFHNQIIQSRMTSQLFEKIEKKIHLLSNIQENFKRGQYSCNVSLNSTLTSLDGINNGLILNDNYAAAAKLRESFKRKFSTLKENNFFPPFSNSSKLSIETSSVALTEDSQAFSNPSTFPENDQFDGFSEGNFSPFKISRVHSGEFSFSINPLNEMDSNNIEDSQFHGVPPPTPSDVFQIRFLGTGCAKPSKFRNNTCISLTLIKQEVDSKILSSTVSSEYKEIIQKALKTPSTAVKSSFTLSDTPTILLDVGEGTACQLFQSSGGNIDKFDDLLLNIRVIWISHHHADHVIGFPMLLEQIHKAQLRRKAELRAEYEMNKELRELFQVRSLPSSLWNKYHVRKSFYSPTYEPNKILLIASEYGLKYCQFAASAAGLEDLMTFYPITNTLYAGITSDISDATDGLIVSLKSVPVFHCQSSFGIVMELHSGHKIVYSGDCRPSQSLVKNGMNCDLLIHEATFDDERQSDATKKRHSTTSEALSLARSMKAKNVVLTHFSQRYPQFLDQQETDLLQSNASLAFDLLQFQFPSQIEALPKATNFLSKTLKRLEEVVSLERVQNEITKEDDDNDDDENDDRTSK